MVKKAATLRDVARVAGVSPSTASRVLNGTGHAGVQTRQRILQAADRLDFRPDSLAKFFATGKSSTVGLLSRNEPGGFAMQVLIGAQKALGKRDLAALMYYADGRTDTFHEHLRSLRARRVDGVIFLGGSPNKVYSSLGSVVAGPVVYAYARSDDPFDASVVPDDAMAGRLAGEHLIGIGRRRIGHITGPRELQAVADRASGLRDALDDAGLGLVPGEPLYGSWLRHWGMTAAERVLAGRDRVDALFCANDQIALGAYRALDNAGVRVPDDIAIVGYDHWSRLHGAPDQFLTTIDPDLPDLGASAAAALLSALDGNVIRGVQKHPCVLVPGESTLGVPSTTS